MNTSVTVQNLKCGGCAHTISTKLLEIENISNINVVIETAIISFDYTLEADFTAVKDKLAVLGYPLVGDTNNVVSKEKSFVSCATGKIAK